MLFAGTGFERFSVVRIIFEVALKDSEKAAPDIPSKAIAHKMAVLIMDKVFPFLIFSLPIAANQ